MQQNNTNGSQPSPPGPRVVASSVGMPVQVFPSGPPPPPPAPKAHLAPQPPSNNRPSPARSPQSFEPPPMGCRPEIKIPANPMAALKKVPKPEPKNDFWIEEYRKERSKSPMVGADGQPQEQNSAPSEERHLPEPIRQMNGQKSQDTTDHAQRSSLNEEDLANDRNRNSYNLGSPQTLKESNNANEKSQREIQNGNSENSNENSRQIINKNISTPQERVSSPFTTSSPTPNLPKPLSPVKSSQEPEPQYYVRSKQQQQQQPTATQTSAPNQWSPVDSAHSRVLRSPGRVVQSPARVVQSPARVISPPPRVLSPLARVMSPPPVAHKPANLRNVSIPYDERL